MSEGDALLERECRIFTRYLLGREATAYVVARYLDAHRIVPGYGDVDAFHRRLLPLARTGPGAAHLADAYARFFAPSGVLRKKLVLLLAILEVSPELHRAVEQPHDAGPVSAVAAIGARVAAGIVMSLLAALVIGPLHLLTGGWGGDH